MQSHHTSYENELVRSFFGSLKTKGVVVFDRGMRYQLAEGEILHSLGYTPEVMIGQTLFEVLPPSTAAKVFEFYQRAIDGEQFALKYYSEAQEQHYKLDFAPIRDASGAISGGRVFIEETTVEESLKLDLEARLNEAELSSLDLADTARHLSKIVEASPFAIAMFDTKMRYIAYSNLWTEAYNLDPERDLVGMSHYDVFPEIGEKWKDDHRRNLAGETLEKKEDRFEREDGSIDYVHWRNVPWFTKNDVVGGVIMFTQVVTERVHNLRELARNATLLAQKNDELEHAVSELVEVNAELERFAYVASHDLQEPLRMVTSYTQVLEQRLEGSLDDDTRRFMGYIVEGAARMRTLIEDLLALSRVNANDTERVQASMSTALSEVLRHLHVKLEERGATVTHADLPTGNFVYTHIYQLLLNLVSNAIKFTPLDRAPVVDIGVDIVDGLHTFRVSDQGVGIPEEHRAAVFESFRRLHSRKDFEGNGIGLAIVQKAVRLNGGRVWVDSNPHDGTTVYFTLPDAFGTTQDEPT